MRRRSRRSFALRLGTPTLARALVVLLRFACRKVANKGLVQFPQQQFGLVVSRKPPATASRLNKSIYLTNSLLINKSFILGFLPVQNNPDSTRLGVRDDIEIISHSIRLVLFVSELRGGATF